MAEHTAIPWRVFTNDDGTKLVGIGSREGQGILDSGFGVWAWDDAEGIANAHMVVLAVNNHDALVKALQSVWDFMNIDVKSGDADLWTEEYDALHAEVCAALNATIDIPSFDPVASGNGGATNG